MKKFSIILAVLVLVLSFCLTGCEKKEERLFTDPESSGNALKQAPFASGSITVNQKATIYLHISGHTQGEIKDYSSDNRKDGAIPANELSEGLGVPTDKETGLPTGRRVYSPTNFVHALDSATPKLRQAATRGEALTITADYYTFDSAGQEVKYYTISYEDAIISDIRTFTDARGYVYESVSFTFGKVTHTYLDGNISSSDSFK